VKHSIEKNKTIKQTENFESDTKNLWNHNHSEEISAYHCQERKTKTSEIRELSESPPGCFIFLYIFR
jgi:hypothetical protein